MVRMEFDVSLQYHVRGDSAFIFNVHAAHTAAQRVVSENVSSNLGMDPVVCVDPHFGNRLMRVNAKVGDLEIRYRATVDIRHALDDPSAIPELPVAQIPPDALPYLLPSRYCPSDRLSKLACLEFGNLPKGYARVEAVRRWVFERTRFAPGTSSTATTALETLTEQQGVCRDFAHLMIALCRALNVPARLVTGIDYGADPSLGPVDFHAYVEAFLGNRWYLFDPTDISPTTGLLRIGTGRDAADVSFATIFGDVVCGMPIISIRSIADPARDLHPPLRTDLAVSTAEGVAHAPMLRLVRSAPTAQATPAG